MGSATEALAIQTECYEIRRATLPAVHPSLGESLRALGVRVQHCAHVACWRRACPAASMTVVHQSHHGMCRLLTISAMCVVVLLDPDAATCVVLYFVLPLWCSGGVPKHGAPHQGIGVS